MGRKCAVEGCLSESNRPEDTGVTFHKVPSHSDIRPKWLSLCRIPDDKKTMKIIYICSRHFLRMDFCNFKGKKYLLRQGVLPSVFPWDKSKLEAIKVTVKPETEKAIVKDEPSIKTEVTDEDVEKIEVKPDVKEEVVAELPEIKPEVDIKVEPSIEETKEKIRPIQSNRGINFAINSRIEALDFNNTWYPARIVEEDYEENEVLIHFEKFSNKYDEWICMDSPRLRPLQSSSTTTTPTATPAKRNQIAQYTVGERCLAAWSNATKFPATVTKVLPNDMYEVLFDDGFMKNLKAHRMSKSEGKPLQTAPLFDPIQTTKQERRDKKRKIDVAALFGKRPKIDHGDEKLKASSSATSLGGYQQQDENDEEVYEPWAPEWENGRPVGVESSIDVNDGVKKSVIVPDPRLPKGWVKHLAQRMSGASAGKWETIIISPDNRRFRARSEIKAYLEETQILKYSSSRFDFSIHRQRGKRKEMEIDQSLDESLPMDETLAASDELAQGVEAQEEEDNTSYLKIRVVDGGYECPIEGCGKIFRKENLAQMHIKHYHPEYTKFLNSTPKVADLAYARTVGESLDKSPGSVKPASTKSTSKSTTPKTLQKHSLQSSSDDIKPQSPHTPSTASSILNKHKDSEIIKLLNNNSKSVDSKKNLEPIQPLPSGLPSNMYPDIKLKDLLNKSEGIPNREDINLKQLSTTRPPTGIKTLLPVVRNDGKSQSMSDSETVGGGRQLKSSLKRKRGLIDSVDSPKGNDSRERQEQQTHPQQLQQYNPSQTQLLSNNVIIEGGQVIKIVRMKQEEIINCTCGFPEEDGLMIQCDLCLCWQHAFCNNIERESQVPEKYVCYICQNPTRQRMSKKYSHDQDWLKQGSLSTMNFHSKDEEVLSKRFEKLKKSHDISGGLLELKDYVNTLKTKLKIAESKNHPKLYLWSKQWDKTPLPEKINKEENVKPTIKDEEKTEQSDSMLMMILKGGNKEDVKNLTESNLEVRPPIIPQPEAAINSADCRMNLLEHIAHSQSLVEERLDEFEKQIDQLDDNSYIEEDEDYPRTRQTCNMLLKDLNTLYELSQVTTF